MCAARLEEPDALSSGINNCAKRSKTMKMKFIRTVFAAMMVVTTALFLAGCGGGDDDTPPTNVAGKWVGTAVIKDVGSGSTWLTLTQNGKSVSGMWVKIPVSGAVDGNNVQLNGSKDGADWSWYGTVDGESMSGTGNVIVSGHTFDVSFQLTRTSAKGVTEETDGSSRKSSGYEKLSDEMKAIFDQMID